MCEHHESTRDSHERNVTAWRMTLLPGSGPRKLASAAKLNCHAVIVKNRDSVAGTAFANRIVRTHLIERVVLPCSL
jgi:hypothetical protein